MPVSTEKLCPYCQSRISPREREVVCPSCHVPHHSECWEENGGCAVYGCRSASHDARHATLEVSPNTNFVPVGGRIPLLPGRAGGYGNRRPAAGPRRSGLTFGWWYWVVLVVLLASLWFTGFLVLIGASGKVETAMEFSLAGLVLWGLLALLPWLDHTLGRLRKG